MNCYVDASVLLRVILGQPEVLHEWRTIERGVGSALVEVECLRTIDRLRHQSRTSPEAIASRMGAVFDLTAMLEVVAVSGAILNQAAQALPTPLGTLDAIHLATARAWRDAHQADLVFATHDRALAAAARASGFQTIGT